MKYTAAIFILTGLICSKVFCQNSVDEINRQIELLKKELHTARLQEMKAEISSENYMKYEWNKYTEEIERAEKLDQKIKDIQEKIDQLEQKKNEAI